MDFRERNIGRITELQKKVGVASYSWIYGVLAGYNVPSVVLAKRIEAATGGLIHWTEFFEEGAPRPDPHHPASDTEAA